MELHIQCEFARIYSNFKNNSQSLADISQLLVIARENKYNISTLSMQYLLSIPLCVLENQIEITDESDWASTQGKYFSGNVTTCSDSAFVEKYHSLFESRDFALSDMIDFLKEIIKDDNKMKSDFYLRNPEVTIRDDVKIKQYSNFKESGLIYAKIMEKAFDS